jgi:chemotaxis-related protein WspD
MPEMPPRADCWNEIGIWGKNNCPELEKHVHCRNCPVYSDAAARLLDGTPPPPYLDEWTQHLSEKKQAAEPDTRSAVIFRLGTEWLALSTAIFKEVSEWKTIHSLPHQRNGFVLGLANIRGELLICVSLTDMLNLEKEANSPAKKSRAARPRLLVVSDSGERLVFPVDEVGGIHHFNPREIRPVPATIAGAATTYTQGVLAWRKKSVGCLDGQLLLYTLNKNLS